jgi:hypothetical protein
MENPAIIASQYTLYEMTDPYVAELFHPKIALKMLQPPPPLRLGLQHCARWFHISRAPAEYLCAPSEKVRHVH